MGKKGKLSVEHENKRDIKENYFLRFCVLQGGEERAVYLIETFNRFESSDQNEAADGVIATIIN